MGITFAVDDVSPATELPRTHSLREHFGSRPSLTIGGAGRRVHAEGEGDGLLSAVHLAFADHRPLVLTPDAIWLTIVRGVAHHVRRNADRLRTRLVRHDGQRIIALEVDDFRPEDPRSVEVLVAAFAEALSAEVGAGPGRLYRCDFSTSTELERTASDILLLDVYSPFYLYSVGVICGIPEITLEGTPEDWRSIRTRIDGIEELELGFWTRHLGGIVDQLIRAAEGAPDREFFQRIYKPVETYGADLVTGWVGWMYPYLGAYAERDNPLLAYEVGALLPGDRDQFGRFEGPCIRPADVPTMLGTCDVQVRDGRVGHEGKRALHFEAGVGAVEVLEGGALRPAAIWLAREGASQRYELLARNDRLGVLLDRIASEHSGATGTKQKSLSPPDELGVLYARFSSASIGDAQLLPYGEEGSRNGVRVRIRGTRDSSRKPFEEDVDWALPVFEVQGATLAVGTQGWLRLETAQISAPEQWDVTGLGHRRWERRAYPVHAREVPIVARSLEDVLTWLLDRTPSELPVLETVQQAFDAEEARASAK